MRFATDATLGKLGRYLRAAGFDTLCQHEGRPVAFYDKIDSDRIVLTRTTALKKIDHRHRLIFIRDNDPRQQIKQVVGDLDLNRSQAKPFSRCLGCNRKLVETDRMTLKGRVPEYVWHHHRHFQACPGCHRIYWAGTHRQRMNAWLDLLFQEKDRPIHEHRND